MDFTGRLVPKGQISGVPQAYINGPRGGFLVLKPEKALDGFSFLSSDRGSVDLADW